MSPECLDSSARKPFYMCAPNDVWSLGVILVNLTCGRNPWKQASFQDSTYRAFARSSDFLKTILPVTDELNDILGRIFHPNPDQRITLPELRACIMACSRLTTPPSVPCAANVSPPATPEHLNPYIVAPPEEAIEDDYDCESPLSPASTISDDGSLTSSGSTISDLDDDFIQEQRLETMTFDCAVQPFEPEVQREEVMLTGQEFAPQQYTGPVPFPVLPSQQPQLCPQPQPTFSTPAPSAYPSKPYFPLWDVVKYVQQVPMKQAHAPFNPQVPVLPSFQGCF
jgi:serine/threonine protein kinase